jgi:hypothetical protein
MVAKYVNFYPLHGYNRSLHQDYWQSLSAKITEDFSEDRGIFQVGMKYPPPLSFQG